MSRESLPSPGVNRHRHRLDGHQPSAVRDAAWFSCRPACELNIGRVRERKVALQANELNAIIRSSHVLGWKQHPQRIATMRRVDLE